MNAPQPGGAAFVHNLMSSPAVDGARHSVTITTKNTRLMWELLPIIEVVSTKNNSTFEGLGDYP